MEYMNLSVEEAAKLLRTQKSTVLAQVRDGTIPAYREGRNWKIPRALLQQYVEERAMEETRAKREATR